MRHKLPPDQKRSHILGVKVDSSVRKKLLLICDRECKTISSLIYSLILDYIDSYSFD